MPPGHNATARGIDGIRNSRREEMYAEYGYPERAGTGKMGKMRPVDISERKKGMVIVFWSRDTSGVQVCVPARLEKCSENPVRFALRMALLLPVWKGRRELPHNQRPS